MGKRGITKRTARIRQRGKEKEKERREDLGAVLERVPRKEGDLKEPGITTPRDTGTRASATIAGKWDIRNLSAGSPGR